MKLCYGTYLKTLKLCKLTNTTQKFLNATILQSVNSNYDVFNDDNLASVLIACSCKRELSSYVTGEIPTANRKEIGMYFQQKVIPLLDPNKRKLVILTLRNIISSDTTINAETVIGEVAKQELISEYTVNYSQFLADVFLYAAMVKNGDGYDSVIDITNDYIAAFKKYENTISIDTASFFTGPKISRTVKNRKFDDVFIEVKHMSNLGLRNPNELRFYHLDIENNQFTFNAISKFLLKNLGSYVFSRAKIEQFKLDDDVESIGLQALQVMTRNGDVNVKEVGNELGEMLIYIFLEQVLNAPKIMSKVELAMNGKQVSNISEGIHLLTTGDVSYQLVFGASSIIGSLQDAVDSAFLEISDILNSKPNEMQLAESNVFDKQFDEKTTAELKNILIPHKNKSIQKDMAFGVFLGYSIDLNPVDYSNAEFRTMITKKMQADIVQNAAYITQKINSLGMEAYSFYFYVLPFNDAPSDKKDIMSKLMAGGVTI